MVDSQAEGGVELVNGMKEIAKQELLAFGEKKSWEALMLTATAAVDLAVNPAKVPADLAGAGAAAAFAAAAGVAVKSGMFDVPTESSSTASTVSTTASTASTATSTASSTTASSVVEYHIHGDTTANAFVSAIRTAYPAIEQDSLDGRTRIVINR
jgi:hypothetical protein